MGNKKGSMDHMIREVRKHRPFTFPQLEQMIEEGAQISDLLLLVPKGVIHSGSIATRLGPLEIATSLVISKQEMLLIKRTDYIGVMR